MPKNKTKTVTVTMEKLSDNEKMFNDLENEAVTNRQTSCYWSAGSANQNDSESVGGNGGDWSPRFDLQEQVAIMWFGDLDQSDGYRSNVKSPEIAGRIQSTMQKLVKLNLEFSARPSRPEVAFFAQIAQLMINNTFSKNKYKFRLNDAFYSSLVHGTAPVTIDFVVRKRKVKMPISKAENMTAEEKKKFKETGDIQYRKIEKIDLRDVVINNRRIQEIYFDPSGRMVHGDMYYCDYYVDKQMISKNVFDSIFKDRVGFKDVDKVKSKSELAKEVSERASFFKPPASMRGDYVELTYLHHYSKDLKMIRANNIFIYEAPLPYVHKKLNIVNLNPFKLPDQIYGIGIVDFLLPAITQIELLQNAIYDYVIYTTNPILMVEKNIYGDFSSKYRQARPGLMIPVQDVSRAVAPLKYSPLSMDVFQALSSLQRDAVIASQQDPSQLGVVVKNATATANIMNKEVMDAYVNFIMVNYTEGLNEIASQVLSLLHQFLTDDDVYDTINGGIVETIREPRRINTGTTKYNIDWDNQTIDSEETPGSDNYLEIDSKMFFYKKKGKDGKEKECPVRDEDLSIELTAESKQLISEALEAQRSKENLTQLASFMVDPADKQKVAQSLTPWIDGPMMLEDFYEKNHIDKKSLLKKSENDRQAEERATEQNKDMMNMVVAIPEAGEPDAHVKIHNELLYMLEAQVNILQAKVDAEMKKVSEQQDPMTMQQAMMMGQMPPVPEPTQEAMDAMRDMERWKGIIKILADHLSIDTSPAYMRTASILGNAQQMTTPPQAPQAPMPGNQGGATPLGSMGNQGNSNPGMPSPMANSGMPGGPGMLGGLASQVQQ